MSKWPGGMNKKMMGGMGGEQEGWCANVQNEQESQIEGPATHG